MLTHRPFSVKLLGVFAEESVMLVVLPAEAVPLTTPGILAVVFELSGKLIRLEVELTLVMKKLGDESSTDRLSNTSTGMEGRGVLRSN
jgi:hypothetical protein